MNLGKNIKINIINMWSAIYLLMIVIVSMLNIEFNELLFFIYMIMAIPFVKSPENYLCISLLVYTISYYFIGADAGYLSITTILIIVYLINFFIINKKQKETIDLKNILSIFLLCIIAVISYIFSPFSYTNGLYKFLYLMILTFIMGNIVKIDLNKMVYIIPKLALVLVFGFIISLLSMKSFVNGRLTIANNVNTNTFGMSCAQLTCILFISYYIFGKKKTYLYGSIIVGLLGLLSGSRGSILAAIGSCCLITLLYEKRRKNITETLAKIIATIVLMLSLLTMIAPITNINISRFSTTDLFSKNGSGSSRLKIINAIIPYVFKHKYYLWGYGPGHECSRIVIKSLIMFNYSHTHNTLLESFCELGIGGLILTTYLLIYSFKRLIKYSKENIHIYLLLVILTCIFLNGLAESYFYEVFFWLILAITRNKYLNIKD